MRVDVADEQRFLEAGRAGQHLALVVEDERVPVEDQLVLPADGVAEGDEAEVVARALDEHLLAVALLADVEGRGGEVDEQLRAREREVGGGRARLPHVLADGRAEQAVAEPDEDEVAPGREVAVLVEDAVVGEEALAHDRLDLAVRADRGGVEEVAVVVRRADERDHVARLGGDLGERALGRADEARPQEEVLGRIAGDRELGEEDDVGAQPARLLEARDDLVPVSRQVADDRVDLRERQPHAA